MVTVEAGHVATWLNRTGIDAVAEIFVDDRMGLPKAMVGPRQPVPPRQADCAVDRP
jgi:hypothetical protein